MLHVYLQGVHKRGILAICQVKELLVFKLLVAWLSADLGLDAVLPTTPEVDEAHDAETYAPAREDCDLCRNEILRISHGLRSDDVANTISDEVDGGDCGFLGIAGNVARDEGQETDKWTGRSLATSALSFTRRQRGLPQSGSNLPTCHCRRWRVDQR